MKIVIIYVIPNLYEIFMLFQICMLFYLHWNQMCYTFCRGLNENTKLH